MPTDRPSGWGRVWPGRRRARLNADAVTTSGEWNLPQGESEDEQSSRAKLYEDNSMYEREWVTPLWMITQEPELNNLVKYLQQKRDVITDNPNQEHVLTFSRRHIEAAREDFSRMVRRGEMRLHRLSELTGSEIFCTRYSRQVVVVGQRNGRNGQGQRFQLVQPLSAQELYAQTDLDLGSRQLERFMWQDKSQSWSKASLVANFVEYDALEVNEWGVFKCISRIKAEEEIWNKVVDEIFEIDALVKREKELRHLSRFVKDVFGLKIVVGDEEQVCSLTGPNLQPGHAPPSSSPALLTLVPCPFLCVSRGRHALGFRISGLGAECLVGCKSKVITPKSYESTN